MDRRLLALVGAGIALLLLAASRGAAESYSRYLAPVDPGAPDQRKYISWAKQRAKAARPIPEPPANAAIDHGP